MEIFNPQGISAIYSCQFSKDFPLPKNNGHFEFSPKMEKHKLAFVSLTVRDRGISLKFSTPRVSRVYWLLFTKITFPPLLAAILNFCVKLKAHLSQKRCEIERFRQNFGCAGYMQSLLVTFCKKSLSRHFWQPS